NREYVRKELLSAYIWKGDFPGAVASAAKFREEFPNSSAVDEAWDLEGQAQGLAGNVDKALEAFGKAAEAKRVRGLLNYGDVLMVEGRIDDAKAAFTKYPLDDAKAVPAKVVQKWLEKIGTDAPPMSSAVNVGVGTPPADWKGKVTACFHWHVQLSN